MTIYKVSIKTEGDITTYITIATKLATVAHRSDSGKWVVTTPKGSMAFDTIEEADKEAKQRITKLFTSLGIAPNFVNE